MLNKISISVVLLFLTLFSKGTLAFDFPECDYIPLQKSQVLLGFDHSEGELYHSLVKQSLMYDNVILCKANSRKALNQYTPWSKINNLEEYYGWVVFAISLLLALLTFSLSPRHREGGITVLGVIFTIGVTWVIASALLTVMNNKKIPQKYIYTQLIEITPSLAQLDNKWFDVKNLREFDSLLKKSGGGIKQTFDEYRFKLVSNGSNYDDIKPVNKESQVSSFSYQVLQQKYENKQRKVKIVQVSNEGEKLGEPKWLNAEDIDFSVRQIEFKNKLFSPRQPLNIRIGPSMDYKRLNKPLTVTTQVVPTGKSYGDWWEVAIVNSDEKGWVNSLWLSPTN